MCKEVVIVMDCGSNLAEKKYEDQKIVVVKKVRGQWFAVTVKSTNC